MAQAAVPFFTPRAAVQDTTPLRTFTVLAMSYIMALLQIIAALGILVGSTGSVDLVPLDKLLSFDDPYLCIPSNKFDKLLNGVIRWQADGKLDKDSLVDAATVPSMYRQQVGKPALSVQGEEYQVTIPLHGTWHGLPLHSLEIIHFVGSEGGFYLVFDASTEQVLEEANKAGFRIPQSGSEYRDEDVMGVNVGVEAYEGRAAIYCIAG